jgi:hypothetical protein
MSATTAERLTWDEICARYPDEWVLLVDADFAYDAELSVRSARVWMHDRESRPLLDAMPGAPRGNVALYYSGDDPFPPDLAFVL